MKFAWKDVLFTLASGFVVQKIVDGEGLSFLNKLRKKPGSQLSMANMPEPILPERFGPQPYAIYYERIVWSLSKDFDLPKIRQARNFLNQHEAEIEQSFHRKVPPEALARHVQDVLDGKASFEKVDSKAAFMARAERVLGTKAARAVNGLPPEPEPEPEPEGQERACIVKASTRA